MFRQGALLRNEASRLLEATLRKSPIYSDILELLSKHRYGMKRTECQKTLKVSGSTFTIEQIDTGTPTIELELEDEITVGEDITLPTGYTSTKSGVTYECKTGKEKIVNTNELEVGEYDIKCTITNGVNKSNNVSKHIVVKAKEEEETKNIESGEENGKEEPKENE